MLRLLEKNSIKSKYDQLESIQYLNKKGIQTSFHYPIPVHQQKPYLKKRSINLPITNLVAKTQLSLPIYPEMSIHDVNKVIKEIINWKKNN